MVIDAKSLCECSDCCPDGRLVTKSVRETYRKAELRHQVNRTLEGSRLHAGPSRTGPSRTNATNARTAHSRLVISTLCPGILEYQEDPPQSARIPSPDTSMRSASPPCPHPPFEIASPQPPPTPPPLPLSLSLPTTEDKGHDTVNWRGSSELLNGSAGH